MSKVYTARQLFDLAPYGAFVEFSDGTPKPPARHARKVRDWESRNGSGYFVEISPDGFFTLETSNDVVLVVREWFGADSDAQRFSITPPTPGTIIARSKYYEDQFGRVNIEHIWKSFEEMRHWESTTGYNVEKQSWLFWRVMPNGKLANWKPTPTEATGFPAERDPTCVFCDSGEPHEH